jgi:hypothetical protein
MKQKVKALTRRSQGRSWEEIRDSLRRAVTGWVNYYALADAKQHMTQLDEWLRRRMRQLAWKQWKTPRNRRRNLKARGVSDYWAIRAGGSSRGNGVCPSPRQCIKRSVTPTGTKLVSSASSNSINFVIPDRTAGCGPARPVVWEGGG